jgi:hypothetical protein
MWRAFFLAIGVTLCILGAECLVVDKAVLAVPHKEKQGDLANYVGGGPYLLNASMAPRQRELDLPEWAPWTLLSSGAVVVLYSLTVAKG